MTNKNVVVVVVVALVSVVVCFVGCLSGHSMLEVKCIARNIMANKMMLLCCCCFFFAWLVGRLVVCGTW